MRVRYFLLRDMRAMRRAWRLAVRKLSPVGNLSQSSLSKREGNQRASRVLRLLAWHHAPANQIGVIMARVKRVTPVRARASVTNASARGWKRRRKIKYRDVAMGKDAFAGM